MLLKIEKLLKLFMQQCFCLVFAFFGILFASAIRKLHVRGEYIIQLSPRLALIHIFKK